jgi:hypothetical protein
MRLDCPHCGHEATIRTSKAITEITREAKVQCNNPDCSHSWITLISAVRTIAPSMTPNPRVYIPLSPRSPAADKPGGNQMELGMEHPPPRFASG